MDHTTACPKEAGPYFPRSQLDRLTVQLSRKKIDIRITLDKNFIWPEGFWCPLDSTGMLMPEYVTQEQIRDFFRELAALRPPKIYDWNERPPDDNESIGSIDCYLTYNETNNPIVQTKLILHNIARLAKDLGRVVQAPDWGVISQRHIILNSISAAEHWVAAICSSTGNSSTCVEADIIVRKEAMEKAFKELDSAVKRIRKLLHNFHNDGLIDNERYNSSVGEVNFGLFKVEVFSCGFSEYWFM